MKYCNHCVLPDTRPNLMILEDGKCNACHSWHEKQNSVDWDARKKALFQLVDDAKKKATVWDCVIPVSGGKDSTWQVIKALELGLKPLCVTWKTPARNTIGQKNLNNLIRLGVDHIDFTINPKIEKIFTLEALKKFGSVAIPMHMALFAIPLRIAMNYKIPLVFWGENGGIEYGGSQQNLMGFQMTNAWINTYGVTQGTTVHDWISSSLTLKDLSVYSWPSDTELSSAGVTAAFLGWYLPWDPAEVYAVVKNHGFEALKKPMTGYYQFADVDDEFIIAIHHWFKWYKFGFTRLWDNLSLEIRANRISRNEALEKIKIAGDEYPQEAVEKFCQWVNISNREFLEIIEKFRNKSIWEKHAGIWKIKNFLFSSWRWT